MRKNLPGINSLCAFHSELTEKISQFQNDHGLLLTSGDNQSAGNGFSTVHAHHDRTLAAIKNGAGCSQGPAICPVLHARKGHRFSSITSADCEHGVSRRVRRVDNVSDLTVISLITAGEQIEIQAVFVSR